MTSSRRSKGSDEDSFVAGALQLTTWAQRSSRVLVLGGVAVAILVAGVFYYRDYQNKVRSAASTELRTIRFQLETGGGAEAVERIRTFLAQFSGSSYAKEAQVLLAHALLLQNRAGDAIDPAREAASGDIGKDVLATRAAFLLAAAYEEVADTAAAIGVYEEIGRKARLTLEKRRGLEGAARLRSVGGDLLAAAELYDQLVELLPEDNPLRSLYQMRAAEMRATAITVGTG